MEPDIDVFVGVIDEMKESFASVRDIVRSTLVKYDVLDNIPRK